MTWRALNECWIAECVFEPRRNHRLTDDPSPSLQVGRRPTACSHPDPSFNVPDSPPCPIHQHYVLILLILFFPLHLDLWDLCASCRVFIVGVLQGVMGLAKSLLGSDGDGKATFGWEVMAKPPLQQHYCTSAPHLCHSLYSGSAQTNPRMIFGVEAGYDQHQPHAELTAGIEGLILAKHIGVINSGSACPIPQRSSRACCISTTILPGD